MKNEEHPIIDAVITWVDGNDPAHKAKMGQYLKSKEALNSKKTRTRYDQVNEIEFVVKSILKNAKFIRNIFIVTDNQTPDFLKDKKSAKENFPTVSIVDHKVIFRDYEQMLPTFNTLPIESLLYKVPNLSEHFLYFNDDVILLNETKPSDFFNNNNLVIRGFWKPFREDIWHKKAADFLSKMLGRTPKNRTYVHRNAQQTSAKILGFPNYLKLHHTVAPLRKSTFENYHRKHPEFLGGYLKHRFRHQEQYQNQSFACLLEVLNNSYVLKKNYQLIYFHKYSYSLFRIMFKINNGARNKNNLFLCLQSLDQCPEDKLKRIKHWLEKTLQLSLTFWV